MPLFEYECRGCGRQFEYLTREGRSPNCPSCQGADLQKRQSVFAVSASGSSTTSSAGREAVGPCGMCGDPRGRGSCSSN